MLGLVTKSTSLTYFVRLDDATLVECHVKGSFRTRGIRSTTPIAVGDRVQVNRLADGNYWITEVCERRNYIIRRSTNLSHQSHILAANLDQVLLLVTLNHPPTSTTFIDRFLATAEAYAVPVVLLFNKLDLLDEAENRQLAEWMTLYRALGYTVLAISAKTIAANPLAPEVAMLKERLSGKTTLLSGNSGVGKSTLLNALFGANLTRVGDISASHNRGTHTTTFSEMYPLPWGAGWLIDTPGIKGFGTVDMRREEMGHYFREMFQVGADCRFAGCTHTTEPDCAVLRAVEEGKIAISRYESYLSMLNDATETKYR